MRLIAFLLFGIIFLGCQEEYPVYSAFCDEANRYFPPCLHYQIFDEKEKSAVISAFGMPDKKECPYQVVMTKYHIGACNNPQVKSLGSDFNGYVRIEIKNKFQCYYKIQSDFKNDENIAFQRVIKKIEEERKFTK